MASLSPLVALRPRSIGELADQIFAFLRIGFLPLVTMSALLGLVPLLLSIFFSVLPSLSVIFPDLSEQYAALLGGATLIGSCFSQIAQFVTTYFLYPLQIAAVAEAVRRYQLLGERPTWGALLATMRRVGSKILGLGLIYLVLGLLGLFTLIIPPLGIALLTLLTAAFYFGACVVPIEGLTQLDALRRGWNLAAHGRWRLLALYLLFSLLSLVATASLMGLIGLVAFLVAEGTGAITIFVVGQLVATVLASMLVIPLLFVGVPFLYFDLRARHEGLDLAIATAQAAGAPRDLVVGPTVQGGMLEGEGRRAIGELTAAFTGLIVVAVALVFGLSLLFASF